MDAAELRAGASRERWLAVSLLAALQLSLVLGWVVGARVAGPGLDTHNYVYLFRAPPDLADGVTRFEPLFLLLVSALRQVTRSPEAIFFAIAAIACLVKFVAVAPLRDASLPVFAIAYVAVCMPFYEYNQIRVAMAVGFVYLAWNALQASPQRSMLCFAVAIGFHYSAVLFALPAAIVVAAGSRRAMMAIAAAIVVAAAVTLLADVPLLLYSYANGLLLRAAEMEGAEVNPMGFGVLLMLASTLVLACSRFALKGCIVLSCAMGLATFALLVRLDIPYSYRVLETFAAALPYAWARAFRGPALQRLAIGGLLAAAVAYAPIQWGRLV